MNIFFSYWRIGCIASYNGCTTKHFKVQVSCKFNVKLKLVVRRLNVYRPAQRSRMPYIVELLRIPKKTSHSARNQRRICFDYLLIFIVEQNLVGIDAAVATVTLSPLRI